MEVSTEKSNITTNGTNNISADISMNGHRLEKVNRFKYLGATLCIDGICSAEARIRIALAMAAMAKLNGVWRCNTISFASKFKLYKKSLLLPPFSSKAVKHGPCSLTVNKRSRFSKPGA